MEVFANQIATVLQNQDPRMNGRWIEFSGREKGVGTDNTLTTANIGRVFSLGRARKVVLDDGDVLSGCRV